MKEVKGVNIERVQEQINVVKQWRQPSDAIDYFTDMVEAYRMDYNELLFLLKLNEKLLQGNAPDLKTIIPVYKSFALAYANLLNCNCMLAASLSAPRTLDPDLWFESFKSRYIANLSKMPEVVEAVNKEENGG